jgi:hypothetical protein
MLYFLLHARLSNFFFSVGLQERILYKVLLVSTHATRPVHCFQFRNIISEC